MFEFARPANAKSPYETLLEFTESRLVSLQLDLCWLIAAREDPQTYFKRYAGRFVSVHVKDLRRLPAASPDGNVSTTDELFPDLADVGSGVTDWTTVLPQCWRASIRNYFVEHDTPVDPISSVECSYRYLDGFRFEAAR